jgi:hypothetical protein
MKTESLYLDKRQIRRLMRRARIRGKSLSQLVREALDIYLNLPCGTDTEFSDLARAVHLSADRILRTLTDTTEYVSRTVTKKRGCARLRCPQ